VTAQQSLGHSTVTVTMRYTHTSLDSKRNAVAKLESFGAVFSDTLHQNAAIDPESVTNHPLSAVVGYN
jgi:hypothetical protein